MFELPVDEVGEGGREGVGVGFCHCSFGCSNSREIFEVNTYLHSFSWNIMEML